MNTDKQAVTGERIPARVETERYIAEREGFSEGDTVRCSVRGRWHKAIFVGVTEDGFVAVNSKQFGAETYHPSRVRAV